MKNSVTKTVAVVAAASAMTMVAANTIHADELATPEVAGSQTIEELKNDYDVTTEDLKTAEADYEASNEAYEAAAAEDEAAGKACAEAETVYETAKAEYETVTDEAKAAEAEQLKEAETAYDELAEEVSEAESAEADKAAELAEAEEAVSTIAEEKSAAEADVAAKQEAYETVENEFNSESEKLTAAEDAADKADAEYKEAVNAETAAEADYAAAENLEQLEADVAEAEDELNAAETAAVTRHDELKERESDLSDLKEQKAQLEDELAAKENELKELEDAIIAAGKDKDLAEADAEAAQTVRDGYAEAYDELLAEKEAYETSLAAGEDPLSVAEKAIITADANVAAISDSLASLQEAVRQAEAVYAKGSLGYFEASGSDAALWSLADCTEIGKSGDTTDLLQMRRAIEMIIEGNKIRKSLGLNELLISDQLMAVSQVQTDISSSTLNHSNYYYVAENLAFGYQNPYAGWYDAEKKIFDALPQSIQEELLRNNSDFFGSYNLSAEAQEAFNSVGHYLNIINPNYVSTGAAWDERIGDSFHVNGTSGQVFYYELNDMFTAEDYLARFEQYYNYVVGNITAARDALTSAENDLVAAQAKAAAAREYLTQLKAGMHVKDYAAMIEEAEADLSAAEAVLAEKQSAYTAAQQKYAELNSQKTALDSKIDGINSELNNLESSFTAARNAIESANAAVFEADALVANRQSAYERLQSLYNQAVGNKDVLNARMIAARKAAAEKKAALDSATSKLNEVSAAYDAAQNKMNKAYENYLSASDALTVITDRYDAAVENRVNLLNAYEQLSGLVVTKRAELSEAANNLRLARAYFDIFAPENVIRTKKDLDDAYANLQSALTHKAETALKAIEAGEIRDKAEAALKRIIEINAEAKKRYEEKLREFRQARDAYQRASTDYDSVEAVDVIERAETIMRAYHDGLITTAVNENKTVNIIVDEKDDILDVHVVADDSHPEDGIVIDDTALPATAQTKSAESVITMYIWVILLLTFFPLSAIALMRKKQTAEAY